MINKLFLKQYFPISLKIVSLFAFVFLMIIGFSAHSTDASVLKHLRNTNLANLFVWSYWWPFIIIFAIFFGRIWCMVCPVELITSFFAKIGLQRKRPTWILSGWAITIFYIIILLIGIQGFAIHRDPFFMAVYLLFIVGVSAVVGLIYEKNAFCQYFCPVGYLLAIYSKLSFFGWRVKNPKTCETCKDKSCIQKNYRYNLNSKSCGVDLYPANIDDNSSCILCAGCLKTCNQYKTIENGNRPNPQLTHIGFANDLFKLKPFKIAEMVFVLIVSGFVISEIWSEWGITKSYLSYFPDRLISFFSFNNGIVNGLLEGITVFVLFPCIIWLIPFIISRLFGSVVSFKNYLLTYSIAFVPIIAAAHLCKAILKTTSRIPYLEHLFSDMTGNLTARQIIDGQIVLQGIPLWLNILVSILLSSFIIAGVWLSVGVVKRINIKTDERNSNKSFYLIPALYGSIFLVMILIWRWF